jgi:hypothetical protein
VGGQFTGDPSRPGAGNQPPYGQPPIQPPYGQPPIQPPYGQPPIQPPYGQPPTGTWSGVPWKQPVPRPVRRARIRSRVYAGVFAVSCFIVIPLILISTYFTYVEITRSARANAIIQSEVITHGGSIGNIISYDTVYTWQVNGVTETGSQHRRDPHDWEDPAYVCYDPNNRGSNSLASPGQTGCGIDELQWGPGIWVANILLVAAIILVPVISFIKWRKWRALAKQLSAGAITTH